LEERFESRVLPLLKPPFDFTTTAAKRYKRVDHATALIWKLLLVAEKTFRRLSAAHLLAAGAAGAKYADGIAVPQSERSPPDAVYTPIDATSRGACAASEAQGKG
jgi:hypothetical protein